MTKLAITGSSGVVGRALSKDLAKDFEIVTIDLHDADVNLDIRDIDALERAFAGCDTVLHLAGASSVLSSWKDVFEINIGGTYNVYEAAHRAGVKRVIFASSNHAVGMHEMLGGPELYRVGAGVVVPGIEAEFRADSLYGVSKAYGEVLGRYYSENFGLQVTCVRIGSIIEGDNPKDPNLGVPPFLPKLTKADAHPRYASTWMSKRDFGRLVRAVCAKDVSFAVIYGVGDNLTRFWDLEPGRAIFGFWPMDGVK
jgi:nucleoside-diphosphate-sugar epimerase